MGCLLKLHLPTILSFLIDVEAHMLSMPGKNNFGSRFNPYRWSAPVYENPDELIEAIQSARFLSKRLKSVRVIGEARPCFKTKRAGSAPLDETRVNCFEAREPFIFDFEDGSSLEFWPQGRDYVRMACSSIPNRIENGLSFNTPTFQEFFISVLGENWQGYELKDFEVVRIKHKAVVTSLIKGKIKEDIGDEIFYRFKFGNDCCFEFRPQERENKYDIFFSHGYSDFVAPSELKSLAPTITLPKHICWSTGPFCDSVDISLYTPFVKNEQKLPRTLKRYVETQVGFSVSEDFVPGCLFESWCNHYDSDCNNGESFDCYGLSLFTLEQMSKVCEEIKDYIGKLKHASIPLEEQSEILRWSENYSSSPTEAEIKEANSLLVDFFEQYCELTEGIMSLCPDCEYISIMGP